MVIIVYRWIWLSIWEEEEEVLWYLKFLIGIDFGNCVMEDY